MLTVLLGGARSGKSTLAVRLGRAHPGPVVYVATSPRIAGDDDLAARVSAHRAERPASWSTVETETDLTGALQAAGTALVIVDCVTTWVGNLVHHGHAEPDVLAAVDAAIAAATGRGAPTVVVSNEVGLGIVPDNPLARTYRDLLGRANQRWVAAADRALLMVAGRALPLHDVDDVLR